MCRAARANLGPGPMWAARFRSMVAVVLGGTAWAVALPGPAAAHPHVWINDVTTFLFKDRQLAGIRHHWEFDEIFSSYVIDEQDANKDGELDRAEIDAIQANAFSNLRDYGYFTHLRIDGKEVPLTEVADFSAR